MTDTKPTRSLYRERPCIEHDSVVAICVTVIIVAFLVMLTIGMVASAWTDVNRPTPTEALP